MRLNKPVSGKILQHSRGMGVPTAESVERRAEELALIEGREIPTGADRHHAWQELHGGHHLPYPADEEMLESTSLQGSVSPSLGNQTESPYASEPSIGEELVAEGLDEAEHDQMLASRYEIDLPEDSEES